LARQDNLPSGQVSIVNVDPAGPFRPGVRCEWADYPGYLAYHSRWLSWLGYESCLARPLHWLLYRFREPFYEVRA